MIELPQVTLACVDTLHHSLALRALERSRSQIRFGRTLFITDALPNGIAAPGGIEIEWIKTLRSRDDYSRFVLKRLVDYVATSHVLLVQWDGYVINPAQWQSAFLQCDYIGARWFWFNDGHDVGNGGFSLRSKRLLTALQDPRTELVEAEDITIGRHCRDWLERDYGIAFASGALADCFAFEVAYPIGQPFGFHGLFNFCRVMAQDELAALASYYTDDIARSPQLAQLLRNCVAMAAWVPAIAIARHMLAFDSDSHEARSLLAQSKAALARGIGVGRNDPCPCGSGKRYRQCHGAIAAPTMAQRDTASPNELVRRGIEAQQRGDLDAAESSYRAALASAPDHPHALHYQGMVEYQRGQPAAALPALLHAVELVPAEPEFHSNLGIVFAALDRNADAVASQRRAIALKPDHAGAWNNLGLAFHAQNKPSNAVGAFNEALRHAPNLTEARWNLALALLAEGRFAEGWDAYEVRLEIGAFAPATIPSTPRWDGRDPQGMRLLLTTEQGLGDAIQFVRFVVSLANRGATVFVQTPSTLTNLFRTVDGITDVVEIGAPLPPHDAWLPLMSLGRHFHIDASSLPGPIPYIFTNPLRRAALRSQLARHPGRIRAGLAWAGNPHNNNDRRRSVPLSALAPLFALPNITWFSLQKSDGEEQLARAPAAASLVQLDARNDFDGIAALVDELDVIVSVDTSIVHLAGALAKPVFVLLPFSSDWRWRISRSDSDWYPTARLFRQPAPGDWTSAITEVSDALRGL